MFEKNYPLESELRLMPAPLEGPSMSAEYFDTLGLIICGFNSKSK